MSRRILHNARKRPISPARRKRRQQLVREIFETGPPKQKLEISPDDDKVAATRPTREDEYRYQTRRPVVCLAFVLPLILAYETGAWIPGSDALRSGIDLWLDNALVNLGVGHLLILPLVTTAALLGWHHYKKDRWQFHPGVPGGMLVESMGLGLILFWVASAYYQIISQCRPDTALMFPMMSESPQWTAASIVSLGSGIYEELIFRLFLLCPLALVLKKAIGSKAIGCTVAVVLASLLFALLHYNVFIPGGPEIEIGSFLFRFAAGVVFSVLFLWRGFGIAVGTHVTFDILTQM